MTPADRERISFGGNTGVLMHRADLPLQCDRGG